MNPSDLFAAGQLAEAITNLSRELRSHPTDSGRRNFLAELLCFAGEWQRAELQLEALAHQDPACAPGVAVFRQLLRAALAREELFTRGRPPEFLTAPTETAREALRAFVLLREGQEQAAAAVLSEAESRRPHLSGSCNGRPFDDLRDLDDGFASVFEILTVSGKYCWVPGEQVAALELRPPQGPRDLLWRQARITLGADGLEGNVYLPAIYPLTEPADAAARLGRSTTWHGGEGTPVRGVGQRMFLVGEQAMPIMDIETLSFT